LKEKIHQNLAQILSNIFDWRIYVDFKITRSCHVTLCNVLYWY